MTAESIWYQIVESDHLAPERLLEQGDILSECPRFAIEGVDEWPLRTGAVADIATEIVQAVVLTQTCDLVQEKVVWVLLAVVEPWPKARAQMVEQGNEFANSTSFRKALVQGNIPPLALLHRHTDQPRMDWSVIDFHQLFVLPKELALQVAKSCGRRLRTVSPYKEHLSQAFARYFMRVGLPHDARAFVEEGGK